MIRRPPRLPRRTALILAAVLGVVAVSAGSALGVASVGLGPTGNLAVAVNPGAGESDDHHLLIQAFVDESRDGFVVRQPVEAPFGSPTITTVDPKTASATR